MRKGVKWGKFYSRRKSNLIIKNSITYWIQEFWKVSNQI
uniref:Uncharacterized protein n=1 Tax=viral metagenome TaxID=1070528 RepID=A0A6C0KYW1_9ZZZZ